MPAVQLPQATPSQRRTRRGGLVAGAIVAATAVVAPIVGPDVVHAAPPQFSNPPTRVYTAPGVDLPFTGSDPITGDTKDIIVSAEGDDSTCVVENPGGEGHSGTCVYAQIQILEANRGAMTIDDSSIAYTSSGVSGDNTFNIGGTLADVQGALASLVYVPPNDTFETTDGTTVTLRVNVQDAQSPAPESEHIDVDIRVEGDNAFPDLTAPAGSPFEVEVNQEFDLLESAGTEVFHVTDEDAEQGEIDDYLMGIAWVDCGLISFPVGGGYATYEGDPADLLTTLGEDASLLPAEVSQNLVFGTGFDNVEAIAWAAHIDQDNDDFDDNFNQVMRWITFHAPSTPGTCTLTIVVTDLGNNGMPLPEEIPFPGVDFDSVEFNVVDPNAPTTTTGAPDDSTTTSSSTSVPGDDTTTTTSSTSVPEESTSTTTSSSVPEESTSTTTSTTEPCVPVAGGPCRTTTTSSTVPGDDTTTTSSTVPGDDTTTTSSTVPGDDTTTTSSTVPGDDTTTTSSTVPGDDTTTTSSTSSSSTTTSTTVPCPDVTTTTGLIADTTTSSTSSTSTSSSSTSSTSTTSTTTTTVPCIPPTTTTVPVCVTTTTAAPTTETTAPPLVTTAPPTVADTTTTVAETTTSTVAETTTTAADTTTSTLPAETTTTSIRPPRTTTTTIIVGIPTFTIQTTTPLRPVPFRSAPQPEHVVAQVDPCPSTTTTAPGDPTTTIGGSSGSLPPTGLLPPTGIQTLPVTGTDTSTVIVIAALLFLAGSTSVVLARRRH